MLYVVNYTSPDEVSGRLGIHLAHEEDGSAVLSLCGKGQENTALLKTTEKGFIPSMKKSIEYIGRKVGMIEKTDDAVYTCAFDNKVSEVMLYLKNTKLSLEEEKEGADAPMFLRAITEEIENADEKKRRYPRDLIVFVADKSAGKLDVRCDHRNIVYTPIVIEGETYNVVMVVPKWPTWKNLRFPVYFALDATTDKREVTRNQVEFVDIDEANKCFEEYAKCQEEREVAAAVGKLNDKFGSAAHRKNKGGNNKMSKGKGGSKNGGFGKNNVSRTGVPSMYKGNAQSGKQKNPRKSGNR